MTEHVGERSDGKSRHRACMDMRAFPSSQVELLCCALLVGSLAAAGAFAIRATASFGAATAFAGFAVARFAAASVFGAGVRHLAFSFGFDLSASCAFNSADGQAPKTLQSGMKSGMKWRPRDTHNGHRESATPIY
jgi:hypothetical protein